MRWIFFFLFGFCSVSVWAQNPMDLRHYGDEKVPVQMYLFSSLACPHCADFHQEILPIIHNKYLKKGQAFLTKVEVIGDESSLLGAMLIRCQTPEKSDPLESDLYRNQGKWLSADNVYKSLYSYAQKQGMDSEAFKNCVQNSALKQKILHQQENLTQTYQITKLPTLVVRLGEKVQVLEGADKNQILNSLAEIFQEVESKK